MSVRPLREVSLAIAALTVIATCTWRAWTWPLGHDEALTWHWFLVQPWVRSFATYDANHHVAFTLLAKASVAAFGDAQWALRLPSTIACAGYAAAIAWLAAATRHGTLVALATFVLAAAGPRVGEYLVAARGYSGALASLAIALVLLARPRVRPGAVGVALGVCVAFNLSFLYAAAGVGAAAWIARVVDARGLVRVALVALLVAGGICGAPLLHAERAHFYFGASGFLESLDSLFSDGPWSPPVAGLREALSLVGPAARNEPLRVVARFAIVLALLVAVVDAARPPASRGDASRVPGLALLFALTVAALGHAAFGLALPRERTALWIAPLLALALARAALGEGAARSGLRWALVLLAVLSVARSATNPYFAEWRPDAAAPSVVDAITADASRHGIGSPVRVAADWRLVPSLRYAAARAGASSLVFERAAARAAGIAYWAVLADAPPAGLDAARVAVVATVRWTHVLRRLNP